MALVQLNSGADGFRVIRPNLDFILFLAFFCLLDALLA